MQDIEATGLELGYAPTEQPAQPFPIQVTDEQLSRLLISSSPSTARQAHGFIFQSGVSSLLRLYVTASYTDEVDAYSIKQPDDEVMRHSFKNIQAGSSVELGDLVRNANAKRDFAMYVGFWSSFKTNIREIYVLRVRADYWRTMFPADVTPFTAERAFEGITNSRADDQKWATRQAELKALWKEAVPDSSPVVVHFKRDHKDQRRVQCGMPFTGFLQVFNDLFDSERTSQLIAALSGEKVTPV